MRYPKRKETNSPIDQDIMEKAQNTNIDKAIENIWMSSKKSLVRKMMLAEVENTNKLRQMLASQGIVKQMNMRGMKNGNLIGVSAFSKQAQYGTWYRDHIEHFTTGFEGRYCVSFYKQNGRITRTFMVDDNELNIIFSYLTDNCNYIESIHSKI